MEEVRKAAEKALLEKLKSFAVCKGSLKHQGVISRTIVWTLTRMGTANFGFRRKTVRRVYNALMQSLTSVKLRGFCRVMKHGDLLATPINYRK